MAANAIKYIEITDILCVFDRRQSKIQLPHLAAAIVTLPQLLINTFGPSRISHLTVDVQFASKFTARRYLSLRFSDKATLRQNMWNTDDASDEATSDTSLSFTSDCDCFDESPPVFNFPPPPRPPFLQELQFCTEEPIPDLETCDALPILDASYHSNPSIPTYTLILLCSILFCLIIFVAAILVWKHKRKVQNFLPCKTSPSGHHHHHHHHHHHCGSDTQIGGNGSVTGVIYEDLNDILPRHHATTPSRNHYHQSPSTLITTPSNHHHLTPSIEMIDVKNSIHYTSGYPMSPHSPSVFLCSSPGPDPYCPQDMYNHPVYEELSDAESEIPAPHSEDEFAEDELSLAGDTTAPSERTSRLRLIADLHHCPPPPYSRTANTLDCRTERTLPPPAYNRRQRDPLPPVPNNKQSNAYRQSSRSLDRTRNNTALCNNSLNKIWRHNEPVNEFHEGMLLDALLQLNYPSSRMINVTSTPLSNRSRTNNANGNGNGKSMTRMPYLLQSNSSHNSHSGHNNHTNDCNNSDEQHSSSPAPYESVSVIGNNLQQTALPCYDSSSTSNINMLRPPPKPHSQDSALGSDSGYSNHTSGTRNSASSHRGSTSGNCNSSLRSNSHRDNGRLSQISGDITALT